MKISTKGEYGIRAMLYLAIQGNGKPIPSHEIAERQGIPRAYLRQILALLAKRRLVLSNRGPNGGHVLGHPAHRITLREILVCLEGRTTSIDEILALPCTISLGTAHCAIREVLLDIRETVDRVLHETTLGQLADRQREILEQNLLVPADRRFNPNLRVLQ